MTIFFDKKRAKIVHEQVVPLSGMFRRMVARIHVLIMQCMFPRASQRTFLARFYRTPPLGGGSMVWYLKIIVSKKYAYVTRQLQKECYLFNSTVRFWFFTSLCLRFVLRLFWSLLTLSTGVHLATVRLYVNTINNGSNIIFIQPMSHISFCNTSYMPKCVFCGASGKELHQ